MVLQFTRKIWAVLGKNLTERAEHLHAVFLNRVQKIRPTFYLDVGVGLGYNTVVFGQNAQEIVAIDLRFVKDNLITHHKKTHPIIADAQFLPLRKELFDVVSLFSVIEHIANQRLALKEALYVLRSSGKLTIQVPNRFFPLELHSGLPFVFFAPSRIRHFILSRIGYGWLCSIDVPSKNKMVRIILKIAPNAKITVDKVIYPSSLILPKLQMLYRFIQKLRLLNFIPLGYLFIIEKN